MSAETALHDGQHRVLIQRILESQATAKQLLGDQYDSSVAPHIALIKACAQHHDISRLQATINLGQDLQQTASAQSLLLLFAAYAEISTPPTRSAP